MPELPEVETIKNQLEKVLVGHKIVDVEIRQAKSFRGDKKLVVGRKIVGIKRRAKMMIVELASSGQRLASSYLLIHLKMTGQLIYQGKSKKEEGKTKSTADWVTGLPNNHTRVILRLDNGGTLFFNDQRLFGWVRVVDKEQLEKEFKNYGPDIIDKKVTGDYFYNLLQRTNRAVKLVILDQAKVAGVGNIYANDGLWCAGISPVRKAKSIELKQVNKLVDCLKQVVRKGIKYGGATASDDNYVNAFGGEGKYQRQFLAYEQQGKKCQRKGRAPGGARYICKGIIRKTRLGGRGTYFCSVCQQ